MVTIYSFLNIVSIQVFITSWRCDSMTLNKMLTGMSCGRMMQDNWHIMSALIPL
jgi:hypothetical protein